MCFEEIIEDIVRHAVADGLADGGIAGAAARDARLYLADELAVLVEYRTVWEERAVDAVGDVVDVNDELEIAGGRGKRSGQPLF